MRLEMIIRIKSLLYILFVSGLFLFPVLSSAVEKDNSNLTTAGVCPPFYLKTESGQIINPTIGKNINKPYSPKQTCGFCHDYNKIIEGYHFMQGKGEKPTEAQSERCQWVSTPGNYGGTWCSPAPLYKYLSPKKNVSARTMDMTSFSFITTGCGGCHPGGGSMEYDRDGYRYDEFMSRDENNLISGGENRLDGDYYQARWIETGVLEADCMICHLPEYNNTERKQQLKKLNFRWAPTSAAGFGTIEGSIADGKPVRVKYNSHLFDKDGKLSPHIVREPRDKACLFCHAKPGWKKRGANFRSRTDVHIRAGLKCVDCHPAGSKAIDERIKGKEIHQFGKGDDPGGHVRDDLDNTVRDCDDCHSNGYLGAPVAKHVWLPPLHLKSIACQLCHIPERSVKAAYLQAGDVFNPGTKIPTKGKHLWTFYGPDMQYWNHYGDLEMMGYDDKPSDIFKPVLARYKEKIYPVNRVHSTWPAIQIEGKPGLMQPKMSDIYKMWMTHFRDSLQYPELSEIRDDNSDQVIEINKPNEIDALIRAVITMLHNTKYPMEDKKVVWVMNDRIYTSGTEYRVMPKELWESSVYGNVHKYNHDVYPANAALGINGCQDCHSPNSDLFYAKIIQYPFDNQGKSVTVPQYSLLGLNKFMVSLGIFREYYIKSLFYFMLIILACTLIGLIFKMQIKNMPVILQWRHLPLIISTSTLIVALIILFQPELSRYSLPTNIWLNANHFIISIIVLAAGFWNIKLVKVKYRSWILGIIFVAIISGLLILLKLPAIMFLTRISYTIFDLAIALITAGFTIHFIYRLQTVK